MIHSLLRSPSHYFDLTPTGQITNKFSNDLGILDNLIAYVLMDVIEGPIISVVMFLNIVTIDTFFLIPGCINIVFFILFFLFCKRTII